VGGRPSGKDSSQARAAISHGCGGRVEEEEGGAAGVCGCGGVGFGGVAGAVPPGPGPGVCGWNGAGTGKGSGASGGSARSGRMACGSGIRGGGGGAVPWWVLGGLLVLCACVCVLGSSREM